MGVANFVISTGVNVWSGVPVGCSGLDLLEDWTSIVVPIADTVDCGSGLVVSDVSGLTAARSSRSFWKNDGDVGVLNEDAASRESGPGSMIM